MNNQSIIRSILVTAIIILAGFSLTVKATLTASLGIGSSGQQVKELQQSLKKLGFYKAPITSYFGPITKQSVINFQKRNGISPMIGYFGPLTRQKLNKTLESLTLTQTPVSPPALPLTISNTGTEPAAQPPPSVTQSTQTPKVKIFLLEDVNTCIIGNACSGGSCVNLKDTATQNVVRSFDSTGLRALAPEKLSATERNSAYCLNLKFQPAEIDQVKNEITSFREKVVEYSQNKINPNIQIIEVANGAGVDMSQYGSSFWLPPADTDGAIKSGFSRDTDFMFVVSGIKDPNRGVYFDASLCDGTIGHTYNHGVGYTWIPKDKNGVGCANSLTFVHGFLHQLANAVNKISPPANFTSYGNDNYTYNAGRLSCSTNFNGPNSYFPDADVAPLDPDFASCRGNFGDNWISGYCANLISQGFDGEECNRRWDKHLLGDHLPKNYTLIGNACRNGLRDFDETGIDSGGYCSIYAQ